MVFKLPYNVILKNCLFADISKLILISQIVSEYGQEILQSQTADKPLNTFEKDNFPFPATVPVISAPENEWRSGKDCAFMVLRA